MTDTFDFDVFNRFSGDVQFTAKLDIKLKTQSRSIQLGAAVEWAAANGAILARANLEGASLARASLDGAILARANLYCANLEGASLEGASLARANLYGASLYGANLEGASLDGAILARANLYGANLEGAKIGDHTIKRLISRAGRMVDSYEFFAFETIEGEVLIRAGCRTMLINEYRAHVAREYPNTTKAQETLDILDFFEKRHAAMIEVTHA